VELPYHVTPVDIPAYDQFEAELLKSSPNNKVPAIITLKVRTGPDLRFRVRGYLDLPACFLRQVLAAFLKGEVQGPAVADVPDETRRRTNARPNPPLPASRARRFSSASLPKASAARQT
jgi:hypothetical protein